MPSEALRIELGGTGSTVSTKDDKLCWGPEGQKCKKPWSDADISSERSMESCCHFPLNSLEPRQTPPGAGRRHAETHPALRKPCAMQPDLRKCNLGTFLNQKTQPLVCKIIRRSSRTQSMNLEKQRGGVVLQAAHLEAAQFACILQNQNIWEFPKIRGPKIDAKYQHPQLLFKTPQIPPIRDQKALNRGTLGVLLVGLFL